jgi:RNA polymerase sigma factor (sigma-70 family)
VDNPEAFFLDNLPLLEQVISICCRRRRLSPPEEEDFASSVKLKLIAEDYAVLRAFQQRSTLRTYLTIVIQRLLIDACHEKLGKWRPSARAERLGPAAVALEKLIERDGWTADEAVKSLQGLPAINASPEDLRQLADRLRPRPRRKLEGEEAIATLPTNEPGPEERLLEREREKARVRVLTTLNRAMGKLPPRMRLALRLRMEQGLQTTEIAELLSVPAKRLYREIEASFKKLHHAILEEGLPPADIALALCGSWKADTSGASLREMEKAAKRAV